MDTDVRMEAIYSSGVRDLRANGEAAYASLARPGLEPDGLWFVRTDQGKGTHEQAAVGCRCMAGPRQKRERDDLLLSCYCCVVAAVLD